MSKKGFRDLTIFPPSFVDREVSVSCIAAPQQTAWFLNFAVTRSQICTFYEGQSILYFEFLT